MASICWEKSIRNESVLDWMRQTLQQAEATYVDVIVFPALIGHFFATAKEFVTTTKELSKKFPNILICPGSYWEKIAEHTYHTSMVLQNGQIIAQQRQLYLANWERDYNLCRGDELIMFHYKNIKMALILSTDVFYPQIARYAAMHGVEIVLSPIAITEPTSYAKQLSGLWQNVQQNLFFAIESAFIGEFKNNNFTGIGQIHAPLALTDDDRGLLAKGCEMMITATLPIERLDWAKRFYNPIRQLNKLAYQPLYE